MSQAVLAQTSATIGLQPQAARPPSEIARVDGFVTCMAVTPLRLAPGAWLHLLVGRDAVAPFSAAETERIRQSVAYSYEALLAGLNSHPSTYELTFDPEDEAAAAEWASGFLRGVHCFPHVWHLKGSGSHLARILAPILLLSLEPAIRGGVLRARENAETFTADCIAALPECVVALYQLAVKRRGAAVLGAMRPQRNDPCDCGSGKKYKKCCGR